MVRNVTAVLSERPYEQGRIKTCGIPPSLTSLITEDNCFIGENRSFGGKTLVPEMIPKTQWNRNTRFLLPSSIWKDITAFTRVRAFGKCEICGGRGNDAHERWQFQNNIQKLMRIQYVCKNCHMSIHIGFAAAHGYMDRVVQHLKRVRKQSEKEIFELVALASGQFEARSQIDWQLDLNFLNPLLQSRPQHGETDEL